MRIPVITLALCLSLFGCAEVASIEGDVPADSLTYKNIAADSMLLNPDGQLPDNASDACVFDTSTFRFTIDALKKFNPQVRFTWDSIERQASVALNETDTMKLHIGGCDHFTYYAIYITDSAKYENECYIAEKAKWMAENFFAQGFNEKYMTCIDQGLYKMEAGTAPDHKWYSIKDPDTSLTDHVYEGWLVEKAGTQTKISLAGYIN